MAVAVMFVGVVAISAETASADTCSTGTTTLRVGSRGAAVTCLQATLDAGIAADGVFGPKTQARVMAWQSDHGLVADGVFGPKSRAVFVAGGAVVVVPGLPAGCTSTAGFSSTTGASCATGATGPCTGGALFNSVTGASCSSTLPAGCTTTAGFSPTTGVSCSSTTPVISASGEGSIAVTYNPTPTNSLAINKGEEKEAFGIKIKASGSDMTVNRVWINLTDGTSASPRIWLSADKATLLDGSTVLGEIALSSSTVTEITAGAEYQLQFNGLNVTVPKDGTKVLSVKFRRPTLTSDSGTILIAANGVSVRATDGAGLSDAYTIAATRTLNFANVAGATGTLTATLASTSPANRAVNGLSTTSGVTTDVKLMDFNLKATDGAINVSALSGTITNAGTCADTGTTSECLSSIELRDGSTVLDSVTGANVFAFADLSVDISADTTKMLSVWAKVNPVLASNVVAGDSVYAVVNSITATTGTDFTAIVDSFSVTGNAQVFYADGINVSLVSKSATKTVSPDTATTTDSGSYVINFDVTAVGADMYLDKSSTLNIVAGGVDAAAGQGVLFEIYKNGVAVDQAVANFAAGPASVLSVDGSTVGTVDNLTNKFKITEGETRHFHLTVAVGLDTTGTNGDGFYRVGMPSINWTSVTTDNDLAANYYTFGLSDFVTPDLTLSDYAL